MCIKIFLKVTTTLSLMVAICLTPALAIADIMVEEIVTTGSRVKARSTTETPAPVDVISASELSNQGDTDISNLLRNSVPSYSVNDQPISDAATFMRPANLRGLAPDHTLILVNGKRRHRGAVITWNGNGISNGSQGPDTSSIPTIALKSVEVLRDGASSIYGSDAIAGVINFQLNNASDGGKVELRLGQYSVRDGQQVTVAMNRGFELGTHGFANLSLEYGNADATSRSKQREDAGALTTAGFQDVPNPAMIWGKPKIDNDIKLFLNFAGDLGGGTEMYGYANNNSKTVDGGFFFRNPINRDGVYTSGEKLLIADMTEDGSGNCSNYEYGHRAGNNKDGAIDLTKALDTIKSLSEDNNCFHYAEIIPGGFTPRFGGKVTDQGFLVGIKGETANGIGWDISSYFGKNKADFYLNNSVNASLGPNADGKTTVRNFDPGYYQQVDKNINADFTYTTSETLSWAYGAEYRVEEFTIGAGDINSWAKGPLAFDINKKVTAFSTSSNGFPGFSNDIAGVFARSNIAAYIETDWDISEQLLIQTALRTEKFDDFGTTTNYKLGGNYKINTNLGVRSTISTGFKAPTTGQINASNISTEQEIGTDKLLNKGTLPATNPVSKSLGAKPLKPEKSKNITLGLFATIGEIDLTVDYFEIDINNRLNLSTESELSDQAKTTLVKMNYPGAQDISKVRFFTNDFATNTSGFDIVASSTISNIDWNLAYNNTKTKVTKKGDTIDNDRQRQIEETTPGTRWNLTAKKIIGNASLLSRINYYGAWWDKEDQKTFKSEYTTDIEANYDFNRQASILVGGNNIFNNKGEDSTGSASLGRLYSQFAPMGFNGAFWYTAYRHNF